MSGTRSPSRTEPATKAGDDRWPVWKLALLLSPFATGAVAINLFMLALMGPVVGLPELSPLQALAASGVLGVPASWAAGRWARHLIDEATLK